MDDPLSALANQGNQKKHDTNALLNEMEDLDNRVIPSGPGNQTAAPPTDPPPKRSHYRSISHNASSFSPSKVNSNTFANFTGQNRKQNHVFPNQNVGFSTGGSPHGSGAQSNSSNALAAGANQNSSAQVQHSPQPIVADEDGDIANLSIFAMDHRITHNFDEMMDEKSFNHDTHSLDLNRIVSSECVMHDKIKYRGQLHNEVIMLHVNACLVQYNPDTKADVVIAGELHLSNYLLFFEPNKIEDVPGGMTHLVVPIHAIGKVTDNQAKYRRDPSTVELEITTRDYRVLRVRFSVPDRQSSYSYPAEKVQQMLKLLAFPNEVIHMFAFNHCRGHALSKLIQKQNEEKAKYEKLRKLKKQDLIKTEVKRRQKLAKQNRKQTASSSSGRMSKPGRKRKKSKRRARKSTTQKTEEPQEAMKLSSPTRDSSEEPAPSDTNGSLQVSSAGPPSRSASPGTSDVEDAATASSNVSNLSKAPTTPALQEQDNEVDSDDLDDGHDTETDSLAPSLHSQGSIDIHNISMELLDEKERLFLKNELWGWHTYNIQKEFERMGVFMDDPNSYAAAQNAAGPNGVDFAALAEPHHTFSDPALMANEANNNPNTSNLAQTNQNQDKTPLVPKNGPNAPQGASAANGANRANGVYDAPTPSTTGSTSFSATNPTSGVNGVNIINGVQPQQQTQGLKREISAAVDSALNHGRSQTQADLMSLKRYRGQLADTRMGSTNYPKYRFTKANAYYELCDTYSTLLVVPMAITDWELQQVAKFRRLGRIPVLTWKSRDNNVAMFRCSQPKVGLASNRSRFDEHLLKCIIDANTSVKFSKLYIMDARPRLNASLNKMKGAGFENVNYYKNVILEFLNVHNIHAMRKSRKALAQIIHQPRHRDKEWLSALYDTEWMTHIREILKGTLAIVNVITTKHCSVLCHCSDGWDRTSQLCGLSQLCLDSYYRTVKGFIVLIDKEWLSFGHQFGKRTGHGKDDAIEDDERSPVFEQFIECTYHLTQQFPTAFEFNDKFLIEILEHLYDCRFGTFLFDCHKQRVQAKLDTQTLSLWTYLQNCSKRHKFLNSFYVPTKEVLYPRFSSKVLKFWNNHYLKSCPQHVLSAEPVYNDNRDIEYEFIKMKREVEQLRDRIRVMKSSRVVEEDELD